jgi:hypothetical protein
VLLKEAAEATLALQAARAGYNDLHPAQVLLS